MESGSIFCPRCGTSNHQKVRFCRQCGLSMTPVTGYLAGEVPSVISPTPPLPDHHSLKPHHRLLASLTPRQKMILSIVLAVTSPAVFGILDLDELSPLAAILMPFAIIFAVFYFRNQEKHLPALSPVGTKFTPSSLQANPAPPPVYVPPSPAIGAIGEPVIDTDRQLALSPERFNVSLPDNLVPGSVTEDETRKLNQPQ
jgi:hypothetical protein